MAISFDLTVPRSVVQDLIDVLDTNGVRFSVIPEVTVDGDGTDIEPVARGCRVVTVILDETNYRVHGAEDGETAEPQVLFDSTPRN